MHGVCFFKYAEPNFKANTNQHPKFIKLANLKKEVEQK